MLQSPSRLDLFPPHDIENQPEFIDPVVAEGIESVGIGCAFICFQLLNNR